MSLLRYKCLNVARFRLLQLQTRFQSSNAIPAVKIPEDHITQSVTNIKKCDKRLSMFVKLDREPMILPFDDVPGPKALKYFSNIRNHLSKAGTHITAASLYLSFGLGLLDRHLNFNVISKLFDSYGAVVRFITPIGSDIVLLNHPDHIQKVFNSEGDYPVRSALDSVEKYRIEYKNQSFSGIYSVNGPEWQLQRNIVDQTLNSSVMSQLHGISSICDTFASKMYNMRNNQDEIPKDIYKELHKWAFDCIGQIIFSKKFSMLETDVVYSHCDMSWLYFSLESATKAINKCENGLHLWKFFKTPSWKALVKSCDSMDGIISKYVLECEEELQKSNSDEPVNENEAEKKTTVDLSFFISSILSEHKNVKADDVCTIVMDMLLIGVNSITSSMSFMLYYLAKYQKVQKNLYKEISEAYPHEDITIEGIMRIKEKMPYLQSCIAETLRLAPPIPVLTRILSKNIHIDRFNIPRGTLIMMCAQNASTKESNFDECEKFNPDRWATTEPNHPFASIPFGYGARKCIGQNIAVTMMSLLTVKILQKYKIEYHYGDIYPTRSFISQPNKELKLRLLDRY